MNRILLPLLTLGLSLAPLFCRAAEPHADQAKTDEQSGEDDTKQPAGNGKDTRLTLKDIQQFRHQRITPEQVADSVAEQGRGFEVTAEVAGQLRRLGFHPAQIDAIKDSSPEPLAPGKWLTSSDEERNQILQEMKQVVAKSKAAIEPIESQHVTLWAAKETQQKYLADVQKLEKFFHTKCAEPIRSGLDRRSTHVVLLKDHAEYEAWCRAMFALFGERFEERDSPGRNAHFREEILKLPAFYWWDFCAICVGELPLDGAHRCLAGGVGSMYIVQLANPSRRFRFGPLHTGFVDGAESAVFGSPSIMFSAITYGDQTRYPRGDPQAWIALAKERIRTHKATPLGELLQMDTSKMMEAHYAEGWTLVGLLSKQPAKFGKVLLAMKKGGSELKTIEKVYGWDEKKLTKEWRAYVMGQGNIGLRNRD